jgi:hypothetical protein
MKGISSNRYGELPVLTVMGSWTSLSFFNRRTKDYTLRPLDININIPNVEELKTHVKKHQVAYSFFAGSVVAGFTCLIMRDVRSIEPISRGIAVTAERGIAVLGKKVEMNNVSYFYSNRQGSPSWVVRCLETNDIFSSQRAASKHLGLTESELSQHLNGRKDHVLGYHFERICMAA